jgi:hypothetical protein
LKLPNGQELKDAIICKDFTQNFLEFDIDELWNELCALGAHPSDGPIPYPDLTEATPASSALSSATSDQAVPAAQSTEELKWLLGTHPALKYRGTALKRQKLWLQTDIKQGLRKYGYTGWQWKVGPATRNIEAQPKIQDLLNRLNEFYEFGFNHCIVTGYNDGKDYIGAHADKDKDFAENSWFCVLKMGPARAFVFKQKGEEIWRENLPAGTAVFVRAKAEGCANDLVQHAVPAVKDFEERTGSLVFRNIATVVPWATVRKEVEKRVKHESKKGQEKGRKKEE